MLQIKVKKNKAGLFTNQDLKKDQIVWKFDPNLDKKYTKQEIKLLNDTLAKDYIKSNLWVIDNIWYQACDEFNQIKRSANSNIDTTNPLVFVTKQDIKCGEELIINL